MAAQEKPQPLVEAVVARGRTVRVGSKDYSWTEGKETRVRLPQDEVVQLRALGFLVDPAKKDEVARGEGPTFTAKEGPGVRVA